MQFLLSFRVISNQYLPPSSRVRFEVQVWQVSLINYLIRPRGMVGLGPCLLPGYAYIFDTLEAIDFN